MRFLVIVLFLTAGCPGLNEVGFDVDSQGQSTVPGSPVGGLLDVFPSFGNFDFSQNQTFQNNNTNKDHVQQAHLTKLTLKIDNPVSATLDFIQTIEFDVSAQNLPTVRIASGTIPAGVATVNLTLDDVDIANYVKADQFSITTKGAGHQPSQDTTIEADLTLHIVASVL